MSRLFKTIYRTCLWLIFLIALAIALVIGGGLTNRPLANPPAILDANSAKAGKNAIRRIVRSLERSHRKQVLKLTELELDGLLSLLNRGKAEILADSDISAERILLSLRLKLPKNPIVAFWGVDFSIPKSNQGLSINTITWGNVNLPGQWLIPVLTWIADRKLGNNGDISALMNKFSSVILQEQLALLTVQKTSHSNMRLRRLSESVKSYSAENNLFTDTQLTQFYFQRLLEIQTLFPPRTQVDFEDLLSKLFTTVWINSSDDNAIAHNRSALISLGVYLGTYHFEKIVGRIAPKGYKEQYIPIDVRLSDRRDLRLHFIYSSTLQLLSDQGAAFSIGEFKELLDSNTGGSGFSFADLAADRAGVIFAQKATASAKEAREFQEHVIATVNGGLLPPLATLQEGLRQSEFEKNYRNIESKQYLEEVARIDQLLKKLPIFKL